MPASPPTKYSAALLKKAQGYLTGYSDLGDVIPTIEGLALHLGIRRETLYAWEKEKSKKELSNTLEKLRYLQKRAVLGKGLTGEYNAAIAKLVLSANHGMHERRENEVTGAEGGPIQVQQITRTIIGE